jgi:putative nucleotide binding protein
MERPKIYENAAYILDFPVQNPVHPPRQRYQGPVAHVIGEEHFTLLEVLLDVKAKVQTLDRVTIAKEGRREVAFIFGRIGYSDLTGAAKSELQPAIRKIIQAREEYFVRFFNTSPPISSRMHTLELIPGLGKKNRTTILNAREREPFKSFDDLQLRTSISDPVIMLSKRVIKELTESPTHILFARRD